MYAVCCAAILPPLWYMCDDTCTHVYICQFMLPVCFNLVIPENVKENTVSKTMSGCSKG